MNPEFMEFSNGYTDPCEITTYLGEKYYGIFCDANDALHSTYFIPNLKDHFNHLTLREWRDKENENKTSAILEKYGIPIPSKSFITGFVAGALDYPRVDAMVTGRDFNIKSNKLFIIGAGASHGLSFERNSPHIIPPLVNELFNKEHKEIYKKFPGVMSCLSEIRFRQDVESYFQEEWNLLEKSFAPELLRRQINTQYYLQTLFSVITEANSTYDYNLYSAFIRYLDFYLRTNINERINIVSFNYDFLLEKAIERRDKFRFKSIADYILEDNRINIFKPHGSANWGWDVYVYDDHPITNYKSPNTNTEPISDLPNWLYNNNITLDKIYSLLLDEGYATGYGRFNLNTAKLKILKGNEPFYPGLLLPYFDKDNFLMPFSHLTLLSTVLSQISEICIIGWKGREEKFNDLLKEKTRDRKIKLTIVDPLHQEVLKNLSFLPLENEPQTFIDFADYCKNLNK